MKHKKSELANLAWVSHFWARYSKLPETFKEGFFSLAINITREIQEEDYDRREKHRDQVLNEGNY